MAAAKILLIEDDESYVNSVRLMLRQHPVEVIWAQNAAQGIQTYRESTRSYATVIVDYLLPDSKGSEVARQIRRINPVQDILFASGYQNPDYLTDMLISGLARTFIPKSNPTETSRNTILESLAIYENKNRVIGVDHDLIAQTDQPGRQFGLIGRSKAISDIAELIRKYRDLPYWIRVTGETGVGKELVVKALVPEGKRRIDISCAEFTTSENAMESELFGHVKGSFTGADQDKPGLLLQAHGQVLFLDEVHTLSMTAQTKLLRVLQEKTFRRKGDSKGHPIPVDFKLISAAKPEIYEYIKNDRFLEDLFHRLGKLDIRIPPLRERPEDIEPLVKHFQDEFNHNLPPLKQKLFRISTIREMEKYPWTGNVRELDAATCQMLVNARADIVSPSDFDEYLKGSRTTRPVPSIGISPMPEVTEKIEIEQITASLKSSQTQVEAAARLGINRFLLIRKMARFGIDPKTYLIKP